MNPLNTMPGSATFSDQDIVKDLLSSQKFITDGYNTFANECASPALKTDMMNILSEEHRIQHDIFMEMSNRGWYPTEPADQNKVNAAKQKYQNMNA